MMETESMSDYDKQQEALKKEIAKIAKRSKSTVATQLSKRQDDDIKEHCRIAYMLMDETIDMYKSGDTDWSELVDELTKALKAIQK